MVLSVGKSIKELLLKLIIGNKRSEMGSGYWNGKMENEDVICSLWIMSLEVDFLI